MTDAPPPRLSDAPRGPRVSALWLAPLIALAVAGTAFWRYYAALGPQIAIALESAAGVEAGRTPIRYRDVEVGRIESLRLSDDMAGVVAIARMDAAVAERLTEGTEFWPVRARISAAEITGVETLLSGAYFGVAWGPDDAAPARRFTALAEPPPTPANAPGRRVALRGGSGGELQPGAPVTFQGFEIGRVEARRIQDDGGAFDIDLFIEAPFDALIGPETRFWNASGVDLELGAEGLRLSVASLSTVLRGGVALANVPGAVASGDEAYVLYPSEAAARDSVFDANPSQQLRLSMRIEQSVRGLSVGAPVQFRGVTVGEVEALEIDPARTLADVAVVATLRLQPRRIGIETDDPDRRLRIFESAVEQGMRARLATGSLLTGALFVELAELPEAPPAALDREAEPHPRIPTAPSAFDALRNELEATLTRVRALPIEALVGNATDVLSNLAAITGDPALRAAPADLAATLAAAREAVEAVPAETIGARAAEALEAFAALMADPALRDAPAQLAATLEAARTLVEGLPVETIGADAATVMENLAALSADPALRDAPANLSAALASVSAALGTLEDADAAGALTRALASAEAAAAAVQTAVAELPAVLSRLNAAAAAAETALAAYSPAGPVNAEAVAALREVRSAARAATSLMQTLERRPNSLILGR